MSKETNFARTPILLLVSLVIATVLQDVLAPFSVFFVKVSFISTVVVYYAVMRDIKISIAAALIGGIFADGLSLSSSFSYTATYVANVFFCKYYLTKQFSETSVFVCVMSTFICVVVGMLLQYICLTLSSDVVEPSFVYSMTKIFITSLISALVALPVGYALHHFDLVVGNKELEESDEY